MFTSEIVYVIVGVNVIAFVLLYVLLKYRKSDAELSKKRRKQHTVMKELAFVCRGQIIDVAYQTLPANNLSLEPERMELEDDGIGDADVPFIYKFKSISDVCNAYYYVVSLDGEDFYEKMKALVEHEESKKEIALVNYLWHPVVTGLMQQVERCKEDNTIFGLRYSVAKEDYDRVTSVPMSVSVVITPFDFTQGIIQEVQEGSEVKPKSTIKDEGPSGEEEEKT